MKKDLLYLRNQLLRAGLKREAGKLDNIIKEAKDASEPSAKDTQFPKYFMDKTRELYDYVTTDFRKPQIILKEVLDSLTNGTMDKVTAIRSVKQYGLSAEQERKITDEIMNFKIPDQVLIENQRYVPQTSTVFKRPTSVTYTRRTTPGTIKLGDKSTDVKNIQQKLIEKNYLVTGADDSAFGPTTAEALFNATGLNAVDYQSGLLTTRVNELINKAGNGARPVGSTAKRRVARPKASTKGDSSSTAKDVPNSGQLPGMSSLLS